MVAVAFVAVIVSVCVLAIWMSKHVGAVIEEWSL